MPKPVYNITIRKRNNKWAYQIQVKDGDAWKYHSSKGGYNLRRDAAAAGKEVADNIVPQPEVAKNTFKQIGALYIKAGTKSASTRATYTYWFKNFEKYWDKVITDVTEVDAEEIITDYYEDHLYNGAKSILGLGKSIFRYAKRKLKIHVDNVFDDVDLQVKSGKTAKAHNILTLDEILDLINKLESNNYRDIAFLTGLMGLCGLRVGEARGMTKQHIDIDNAQLKVLKQRYVDGSITTELKTANSERTIPLPGSMIPLIKRMAIPLKDDGLYVNPVYVSLKLKEAYQAVGYELRPHDLRHSYATNLIQRGVDFKTVSMMLGNTVEMVTKTYSHVNNTMLENAKEIAKAF